MALKSVALCNRKHSKKAVSQTRSGYMGWGIGQGRDGLKNRHHFCSQDQLIGTQTANV